ncbi:hypothetical protein [Cognatiluteimonas weifangensis]|uniref:Uncharacterized protein n=1 Tax=Cognatiluteimonas weifangensis TaxID=2303539 RepID=A0A372DI97_9GAMM|nr:hypothetical protein [Luteimonas weifangensis]RFP59217.1 hypothetical protein D0Y53_11570 [Luteimonas weifangensis]
MPASRSIQGSRYLLPCLLLLSAGAMATGRDVRLHGPNGDGGSCPDATPAPATPADKPAAPAAASRNGKIKPVITVRGSGSDDGSSHTPRWHSFLPGMFR